MAGESGGLKRLASKRCRAGKIVAINLVRPRFGCRAIIHTLSRKTAAITFTSAQSESAACIRNAVLDVVFLPRKGSSLFPVRHNRTGITEVRIRVRGFAQHSTYGVQF